MAREFSTSIHIDAPRERVVQAITDFDSWEEWMPGLVSVEPLGDDPYGVGTVWKETRKMFGKEATEQFEVLEFDPPGFIRLYVDGSKGSSKRGAYEFSYRFSDAEDGTLLELDGRVDMPGVAFRLLGGMLIGTFRKAVEKDHEALKSYVERMDEA